MAHPICDLLKKRIREFVSEKNESVRWLWKQIDGVDYSTIYRLQTGEQKSLSFFYAQKILKYIEPENYVLILGEHYPDETRELVAVSEAKTAERTMIYERIVGDAALFKVFIFASTLPGATSDEIRRRFGEEGVELLHDLIGRGAIEANGSGFIDKLEGVVLLDEKELKMTAQNHLSVVSLDVPGSHIHNIRANLSEDGVKEWYQAAVDYKRRLHQIAEAQKGDVVAVASAIVGPAGKEKGIAK